LKTQKAFSVFASGPDLLRAVARQAYPGCAYLNFFMMLALVGD
jgi:hypothetical protein